MPPETCAIGLLDYSAAMVKLWDLAGQIHELPLKQLIQWAQHRVPSASVSEAQQLLNDVLLLGILLASQKTIGAVLPPRPEL